MSPKLKHKTLCKDCKQNVQFYFDGSRPSSLLKVKLLVAQWCPALCDPMDCSRLGVPPSMGFDKQKYWGGLPFPSSGIFPTQ